MQTKKNIKLIILLAILIVAALIVYFSEGSSDKINVNRSLFAYNDPSTIDAVTFQFSNEEEVTLSFNNNGWVVNEKYEADPQRIKVLFAIVKQIKVRRPVAKQQADSIGQLMEKEGVSIQFYEQQQVLHEFKILGEERRGLTYIKSSTSDNIYLAEIPGYRSYLAGIFTVDQNGWRDPLVFDLNWRNMQSVQWLYPNQEQNSFDIEFDGRNYKIAQLQKTDTTKLFNLLDDTSLLYLNDYLTSEELKIYDSLRQIKTATINVQDVGKNNHTLEVLGEVITENTFLVRVDSVDFGLLPRNKLREVLRPRRFFEIDKK